jgi:DNA invertase Pin-like site-specific DNA recombinase
MRLGYARSSTDDQSTDIQVDRLQRAGCDCIYQDEGVSGVAPKRRALEKCLTALERGDVLVVCSLDRLGRSLAQLITTIERLRLTGVHFESLSESINTGTPQGVLMFHVLGALAQFERAIIAERTFAGRVAAKQRGVKFGRPHVLNAEQVAHAVELVAGGATAPDVAKLLGCSRSSAYRALRGAARQVYASGVVHSKTMSREDGEQLVRDAAALVRSCP